ncbi:hypothetical protein [Rickettsia endosymbiont of Lasioglossum villosulum]|uniref:beta strand repeat-containing protein n=1 Tax=Rickettsia endosymbiont of Lasioglossum villosulum TaxID=3066269 RepID=UPI003132A878
MKNKFKILKGFLATASLYGSLISSFNVEATSILTTGNNVSLSSGAGLIGGLFTNGATIQIVANLPGLTPKISADKANAQIDGINTLVSGLIFGGVEVSQNTQIGPLNATIGLNPNFGPLKFIADNATATITGVGNQTFTTMDFAGKNSTLQINDNLTINTTIDSTGSTNGTLNLGNGVTITKDIGGTNSLSLVSINGSGNINFGGIVKANAINLANAGANVTATGLVTGPLNYTQGGNFTVNAGIVGNIDFKNQAGTFTLADGMKITGSINSTGGIKGTLNAVGGTITGTINNLNLLQCNGGTGKTLNLQGDAIINTLVFANAAASGTVNASGKLTLSGLTFNNNNAAGGTLIIGAASTINGSILNGIKGTIQLNANLTINDPSAGSVNEIDIADNTIYTIDAKNGDVDLLNNGAKINFLGKNSELDLVNTGNADHKFMLFANLIPSTTQDIYSVVRVSSTTNGLTIANNGAFTIGQDATHRLQNFIVDGGGNITIAPTVFTSLLTVNNTNQVTFNQPLNLGTNGQVIYKANGTLVVNGVTGAIITNAPNQGTLTINSGNITGAIGDATNSLLAVNIAANGNVTLGGTINATSFNINNAGANITAQGQITSNVLYNQSGTLNIQNSLTNIDFNNQNGVLNVNGDATLRNFKNGTNAILNINSGTTTTENTIVIVKNITIGSDSSAATLIMTPTNNPQNIITFGSQGGKLVINQAAGTTQLFRIN